MAKLARVEFAFEPYELQQEIIDYLEGVLRNKQGDEYRFLVAALGRQSGKSWLAKYVLLDKAINQDGICMWVAPTIPTARGHWDALVKFVRNSGLEKAGYAKINQTAKDIKFIDGGYISVRSAVEPDNLRGASLDLLVLDEAAFYRNGSYVWWSVCFPMVTATGGKVLFTTTPNGRNWVYDLFKMGQNEDNPYYKSWNVPSVASPYQDEALLAETKRHMPSLQWREEFEAEFLADGGGVFAEVERAAVVPIQYDPITDADLERYVAGIDIGYRGDYTVFTVIDTLTRQQVFIERFTNIGTIRTMKRIIELLDLWQPHVTHIESNGNINFVDMLRLVVSGEDISDIIHTINDTVDEEDVEDLSTSIGKHKIKALHMDNDIKRELVERVAADIEYRRLQILSENCDVGEIQISEMSTYERKPTASGMKITYNAAEGSHDDCISALYLAYKGVPKPVRRQTIEKIKSQRVASPFRSRSLSGRRHRR